MDNRSLALFLSGLAAAGAAVCIAVACSDQPHVKCTAGRGGFSAKYTRTAGDTDGGCLIPGEGLVVQAYNPANSDRTNADLSKGSIAIEPGSIAAAVDSHGAGDDTHKEYSEGPFVTGEPGADNFCNVGQMTVAEQDNLPFIPAVPPPADAGPDAMGTPSVPGQSLKYEWSNVRVFVKASSLGTQLVGDVTYTTDTINDPDAGTEHCNVTYHVVGLYPQIPCASFCDCLPYADPDNMRATGSGISPDLFAPKPPADQACEKSAANAMALEMQAQVTCDPGAGLCVLKSDPK